MSSHRAEGRIVIVDDSPTVRDALSTILDLEGFEVMAFSAPEDFMAVAGRIRPDCVLLDIGFPSRSGLDVLKAIGGAKYRAPVIVISGLGDPSAAREALGAGAWACVEKPFDAQVLLEHIRRALADRSG